MITLQFQKRVDLKPTVFHLILEAEASLEPLRDPEKSYVRVQSLSNVALWSIFFEQ